MGSSGKGDAEKARYGQRTISEAARSGLLTYARHAHMISQINCRGIIKRELPPRKVGPPGGFSIPRKWDGYQPTGLPRFCSLSQCSSGAK